MLASLAAMMPAPKPVTAKPPALKVLPGGASLPQPIPRPAEADAERLAREARIREWAQKKQSLDTRLQAATLTGRAAERRAQSALKELEQARHREVATGKSRPPEN